MEADQLYSYRIDELRKLFIILDEKKAILIRAEPADWIDTIPFTRLNTNLPNYKGWRLPILNDLLAYWTIQINGSLWLLS
jgi:hypothetical protein